MPWNRSLTKSLHVRPNSLPCTQYLAMTLDLSVSSEFVSGVSPQIALIA
jgi:hypothetical protein